MMKQLVKCSKIHRQMQEDTSPSDGDNKARKSSPVCSPDQSENPQFNTTSTFTSTYSAIFQPNSPLPTSVSFTPSDCSYDEENNNVVATENRLQQARYVLEYQELYDQYTLCIAHLQESTKEVELLRQENANLRFANKELLKRLNLLSQATIQNSLLPSGYPPLSLVNDFHCLSIGGSVNDSQVKEEISDISPTSVIGSNQFETSSVERVTLPKSISVRSSGYLKMNQGGGSNGGPSRNANRQRLTSEALGARQRVYVPGGRREEDPVEFEVYNQGMFKTELCNKWQQTGTCPYGEHCQFAHGINELRPVIRHPRYKTEVCRMVLAGDICPYGHRCHFRHSLTDQERLLGPS